MVLKAVFFDFDGTLANTDPVHLAMFAELLAPQGIQVDEAYFRENIAGGSNRELFKRFFPGISDKEANDMSEKKEEDFRKRVTSLEPISGLEKVLSWSREHHLRLALITNAPKSNIDYLLPLLGLSDCFEHQITGDSCKIGKPQPDPYLMALNLMHLEPENVIVFEDSHTGISSSRGAGIFTVGLTTTHTPQELQQAGANAIISDYNDARLWEILQNKIL